MTNNLWIKCPLCGMHRKLDRSGMYSFLRPRKDKEPVTPGNYKGRVSFGLPEGLDVALIVNEREIKGSPEGSQGGGGFFVIGGLTLKEMVADPEYADLVEQIREAAMEILDVIIEGDGDEKGG